MIKFFSSEQKKSEIKAFCHCVLEASRERSRAYYTKPITGWLNEAWFLFKRATQKQVITIGNRLEEQVAFGERDKDSIIDKMDKSIGTMQSELADRIARQRQLAKIDAKTKLGQSKDLSILLSSTELENVLTDIAGHRENFVTTSQDTRGRIVQLIENFYGTPEDLSTKVENILRIEKEGMMNDTRALIGADAKRYKNGSFSKERFRQEANATLRSEYTRAYARGKKQASVAGKFDLTNDEVDFVENQVAAQMKFFDEFIAQAELQKAAGIEPKRVEQRARLYGGRVGAMYEAGWVTNLPDDILLDWKLGLPDHCNTCPIYSSNSPYLKDTLPGFPQEGFGITECGTNCKCSLGVNELSIDELDKDDPDAIDVPPIIIDDTDDSGDEPTKNKNLNLAVALAPEYKDKRADDITDFENRIRQFEGDLNAELKTVTATPVKRHESANTVKTLMRKARSKKAKEDTVALLKKLNLTTDDITIDDIPIQLQEPFFHIKSRSLDSLYKQKRGAEIYVSYLEKQQAIENMPHSGQYTDRDKFFELRNKKIAKEALTGVEEDELRGAYGSVARVLTKDELDSEKDVMIESIKGNSTGWNQNAEESLKVLPLRNLHKMSEYNDRYDNFGIKINSTRRDSPFYRPGTKKSNMFKDNDIGAYIHENLHGVDHNLGENNDYGLTIGAVKRFQDDTPTDAFYANIADEMKALFEKKASKGYKKRKIDGEIDIYRNGRFIDEYVGRVYGTVEGMEYITMNGEVILGYKLMTNQGNSIGASEILEDLDVKDKEFIEWGTRFFSE